MIIIMIIIIVVVVLVVVVVIIIIITILLVVIRLCPNRSYTTVTFSSCCEIYVYHEKLDK